MIQTVLAMIVVRVLSRLTTGLIEWTVMLVLGALRTVRWLGRWLGRSLIRRTGGCAAPR